MTPQVPPVDITRLKAEAAKFGSTAYLLTVAGNRKPHCSVVVPGWDTKSGRLVVAAPGTWAGGDQAGHRDVTVLWPPALAGGYSLIVDGTAATGTGPTGPRLAVTPTRAVLHRPERTGQRGSTCSADCIQIIPS